MSPITSVGTFEGMGLMRKVVALGVAKKVYDEARKPENQKRIQEALDSLQKRRGSGPRR